MPQVIDVRGTPRVPRPPDYSPRHRAERIIAAGRLFLAGFLTLAVVFDPHGPGPSQFVRALTASYLVYAAALWALTAASRTMAPLLPLITHVADLVLFSAFMYFTESPTSPFFVCFVFATICGAIRWYGRGALATGAAALAAYAGITVAGTALIRPAEFDAARFIIRCTHLAIVAGFLAYLGEYQHRLQREIAQLAAWPRRLSTVDAEALEELLTNAAHTLRAPRVVLAWNEGDEPALRIACRSAARFEFSRERPDRFGSVVAEDLQRSSFFCTEASASTCETVQRVPGGFRFWRGVPLVPSFRERFTIKSVLALRVVSDGVDGWLLALDRPNFSVDDLLLGDIVGRLVAGALEQQILVQQLKDTAAVEERLRLARELHDGVLQALTAAALQAQRARDAAAHDPAEALRRLERVEEAILAEQRSLRLAIDNLKPGSTVAPALLNPAERLREVAEQVARQWEVQVDLDVSPGLPKLRSEIVHEVSRMLQEALVNAIRHGRAQHVTVTGSASARTLRLTVAYVGRAFPHLHGRYDLETLVRMQAGPRTLKERITSLGGGLVIESSDHGASVEMEVPLT